MSALLLQSPWWSANSSKVDHGDPVTVEVVNRDPWRQVSNRVRWAEAGKSSLYLCSVEKHSVIFVGDFPVVFSFRFFFCFSLVEVDCLLDVGRFFLVVVVC